ncbi:hypothetical protein BsWGS_09048 [Bradybaena similaris]
MQPTYFVIFLMNLLSLLAVCCCRPSALQGEDSASYNLDEDMYMRVSMSCSAILGALKAQAQNLLPPDYKTTEKRTVASTDSVNELFPNADNDNGVEIAGIKRRIFWQPLGYMPAAARANNGLPATAGNGNQGISSSVFRYG